MNNVITDSMLKSLEESHNREIEFFKRHGIDYAMVNDVMKGEATPAWRAWVKSVEHEYNNFGKEVRVHLDMPISRKAFILGYLIAKKEQ